MTARRTSSCASTTRQSGRAWLGEAAEHVTTAAPWTSGKPLTTLNIALTADGLSALGVAPATLETFAPEFRRGMAARAKLLGDVGLAAPASWEPAFGTGEAHVLLDRQRADARRPRARDEEAARRGARRARREDRQRAARRAARRARASTSASPTASRSPRSPARPRTRPRAAGSRRRTGAGARSRPASSCSATPTRTRSSTAGGACRRARRPARAQRRRTWCGASCTRTSRCGGARSARPPRAGPDGDERKLAAKVVGRWPDGAPLVTHPNAAPTTFDPAAPGANDFRYGDDLDGRRCPLGAHIRRSNPRDALGHDGRAEHAPPDDPARHAVRRRRCPTACCRTTAPSAG